MVEALGSAVKPARMLTTSRYRAAERHPLVICAQRSARWLQRTLGTGSELGRHSFYG